MISASFSISFKVSAYFELKYMCRIRDEPIALPSNSRFDIVIKIFVSVDETKMSINMRVLRVKLTSEIRDC